MNKKTTIKSLVVIAVFAIAFNFGLPTVFAEKGLRDTHVTLDGKSHNAMVITKGNAEAQKHIDKYVSEYAIQFNIGPAKILMTSHDYGAGQSAIDMEIGDKLTLSINGQVSEYILNIKEVDGWDYRVEGSVFLKEASNHDLVIHTCVTGQDGLNHYLFFTKLK